MNNFIIVLIGILLFQFLNVGITQNSNQTKKSKMSKYKELNGEDLVGEVFVDISQEVWYGKKKIKTIYQRWHFKKK